jgi:hypothetical protein
MTEPKKEPDVLETSKRAINKVNGSSQSVTLPKIMKAIIALKKADTLEVKTVREKNSKGEYEVYLEVRFLNEEEEKKHVKP